MDGFSRCVCALILVAAFVICGASDVRAKDVILTNASAGRFLGSLAEMQIIAASEGAKVSGETKGTENPFQTVLKAIKSSKLKDEAATVATKHGFSGLQDWTNTGRAIGQAYIYVTAGAMRGLAKSTVDKHKDMAAKELEKLGLLTEKQKKKLRDNLDEASDELSREPPAENIKVINTIKPTIDAAIKAMKG